MRCDQMPVNSQRDDDFCDTPEKELIRKLQSRIKELEGVLNEAADELEVYARVAGQYNEGLYPFVLINRVRAIANGEDDG